MKTTFSEEIKEIKRALAHLQSVDCDTRGFPWPVPTLKKWLKQLLEYKNNEPEIAMMRAGRRKQKELNKIVTTKTMSNIQVGTVFGNVCIDEMEE